ncbi:MAG: c-type cytochrome [Planctomycetota bacterium]|nr:c-type cytochrome [Planctomycetota bacterium]
MKFALAITALLLLPSIVVAEDVESVVTLLEFVIDVDEETAAKCLATLRERVQSGEVTGPQRAAIRKQLGGKLQEVLAAGRKSPLYIDALLLATSWGDKDAAEQGRSIVGDAKETEPHRIAAIDALTAARDVEFLSSASSLLGAKSVPELIQARLLGALGRYDDPTVAKLVLACYAQLVPDLQPQAIELLTQRAIWSRQLLDAIGRKDLPTSVLNVNQVRTLLASPDKEIAALVQSKWGAVRTERNPERERVIRDMHDQLSHSSGNPHRGREVFNRVCGQCHKIYGVGQEVGPEITANGRGSFEHLLANVFDPSLVIGASYQARMVLTADGRVLTGLLAEDNEQRIVLKTQGGKLEIVPREEVDEIAISKLSLMPEGLEKQLPPEQLADLFAFLSLDQPPDNPNAVPIAGTPPQLIQE